MIDKLAWRFCLKVRWRSPLSLRPAYHDELLIIFAKLERFRVHRWSICTIVVFSAIRSLQTNENNCEIMNADFVRRSDTPNKTDESDSLRAFVVCKGEAKKKQESVRLFSRRELTLDVERQCTDPADVWNCPKDRTALLARPRTDAKSARWNNRSETFYVFLCRHYFVS